MCLVVVNQSLSDRPWVTVVTVVVFIVLLSLMLLLCLLLLFLFILCMFVCNNIPLMPLRLCGWDGWVGGGDMQSDFRVNPTTVKGDVILL